MTLIIKADVEYELQLILPVGYIEINITDMADAAEDYLKLKSKQNHIHRFNFIPSQKGGSLSDYR